LCALTATVTLKTKDTLMLVVSCIVKLMPVKEFSLQLELSLLPYQDVVEVLLANALWHRHHHTSPANQQLQPSSQANQRLQPSSPANQRLPPTSPTNRRLLPPTSQANHPTNQHSILLLRH